MQNAAEQAAPDVDDSAPLDPEDWVDHYGDAMYRYAISKLRDPSVAEEVVQETFLAALRSRDRFKRQSSVSTWLLAILRRKVADHYRSAPVVHFDPQHPDAPANQPTPSCWSDDPSAPGRAWDDDPATIFENREFWKVFETCVGKLPDKLAEVHMLREINQQSAKEVCKILGISPTNLSMRLHRCRAALRDCLEQHWFK